MTEDKIEKEDDNIYDKKQREEQMNEDEITPAEAGFMEGYEDTKLVECNSCGKQFAFEQAIEREISGKMFTFCSQKCAELFEKRKAHD